MVVCELPRQSQHGGLLVTPIGQTYERQESEDANLQGQALRRMRRASERGTGCHLTAEMIQAFSSSTLAEWWSNVDDKGYSTL